MFIQSQAQPISPQYLHLTLTYPFKKNGGNPYGFINTRNQT